MCVLSWHGGVNVRKIVGLAGICAALALFAGPMAFALEEQRGAAPAPAAGAEAPKAEVQDGATAKKPDAGTEIRIPGLGKLGTLPKMDFGLELLYGAAETKQQDSAPPPQLQDSEPSDITIHGSVKHRF
jgi:hypothetical protein